MFSGLHKKRLTYLIIIVACLAAALALILFALSENIALYYTPTDLSTTAPPKAASIRIGGMVEKGSVSKEALHKEFIITDFNKSILVRYNGILPDLFKEGTGVVVAGKWAGSIDLPFEASEVLAKHDENYMPPKIKVSQ